jgi:hypothetical protein
MHGNFAIRLRDDHDIISLIGWDVSSQSGILDVGAITFNKNCCFGVFQTFAHESLRQMSLLCLAPLPIQLSQNCWPKHLLLPAALQKTKKEAMMMAAGSMLLRAYPAPTPSKMPPMICGIGCLAMILLLLPRGLGLLALLLPPTPHRVCWRK